MPPTDPPPSPPERASLLASVPGILLSLLFLSPLLILRSIGRWFFAPEPERAWLRGDARATRSTLQITDAGLRFDVSAAGRLRPGGTTWVPWTEVARARLLAREVTAPYPCIGVDTLLLVTTRAGQTCAARLNLQQQAAVREAARPHGLLLGEAEHAGEASSGVEVVGAVVLVGWIVLGWAILRVGRGG